MWFFENKKLIDGTVVFEQLFSNGAGENCNVGIGKRLPERAYAWRTPKRVAEPSCAHDQNPTRLTDCLLFAFKTAHKSFEKRILNFQDTLSKI